MQPLKGIYNGCVKTQLLGVHPSKLVQVLVWDDEKVVTGHLEESVFVFSISFADHGRTISEKLPSCKEWVLVSDDRCVEVVVPVNERIILAIELRKEPPNQSDSYNCRQGRGGICRRDWRLQCGGTVKNLCYI